MVCEPSVLEEDLIKQDDFKDIAGQLITWEDGMPLYNFLKGGTVLAGAECSNI